MRSQAPARGEQERLAHVLQEGTGLIKSCAEIHRVQPFSNTACCHKDMVWAHKKWICSEMEEIHTIVLFMIQGVNTVLDIGLHLWVSALWLSFILQRTWGLTCSQEDDQANDDMLDLLMILNRLPCS